MKTIASILISAALTLSLTTSAMAQDDDDDLFGGDTGDGDGLDGVGDDGTTGDGGGDGGTSDGSADAATSSSATPGDVGKGSGTLGLGFSATATGLQGAEAEYWLSPTLAATGIARLQFVSGDGDDNSATFVQLGAGALLVLKARGKVALMGGGRFLLGFVSPPGGADSTTSIAIEVPLRLQMAVHENISLHVEGGAAILFGDQSGLDPLNPGSAGNNFTFAIGSQNLFGSGGITFYFK